MSWLKRGNPLARIGIVILFFGAAFLAKYAADNSMFPIELRFIGLALGAFALLIVGWRLRERRAVYAQLLQGGGIAGLYLTVFAATRLYQLLPFTLAFVLLAVIALAAPCSPLLRTHCRSRSSAPPAAFSRRFWSRRAAATTSRCSRTTRC